MLVNNTKEMLEKAKDGKYAIGAFNIENMEFAQAVIWAASELNAPVILQTSVNTLKYASPKLFYNMVLAIASEAKIPVAIHLDHGESFIDVMKCVKGGYGSIMFDGSLLPYIENVEKTQKIVETCSALGITVEGELGAVVGKKNMPAQSKFLYTDPDTAADFVQRTGVDSLAVSIGTVHGLYKSEPCLDYERLLKIKEAVAIPLVLHGASGLNEKQIKECIYRGITKVNIATELRLAWTNSIKNEQKILEGIFDPKKASGKARKEVMNIVKEKINILGSNDKA